MNIKCKYFLLIYQFFAPTELVKTNLIVELTSSRFLGLLFDTIIAENPLRDWNHSHNNENRNNKKKSHLFVLDSCRGISFKRQHNIIIAFFFLFLRFSCLKRFKGSDIRFAINYHFNILFISKQV